MTYLLLILYLSNFDTPEKNSSIILDFKRKIPPYDGCMKKNSQLAVTALVTLVILQPIGADEAKPPWWKKLNPTPTQTTPLENKPIHTDTTINSQASKPPWWKSIPKETPDLPKSEVAKTDPNSEPQQPVDAELDQKRKLNARLKIVDQSEKPTNAKMKDLNIKKPQIAVTETKNLEKAHTPKKKNVLITFFSGLFKHSDRSTALANGKLKRQKNSVGYQVPMVVEKIERKGRNRFQFNT